MSHYAERVFEQFQKEKGSFNRWLLAALLLSIFYSFVFQPYLTLLTDLAELEKKQKETVQVIKNTDREIKAAKQSISRVDWFLGDEAEYNRLYDEAIAWVSNSDELQQKYDLQSRKVNNLRDSLDPPYQQRWTLGEQPDFETIRLLKNRRYEIMQHYQRDDKCFFKLETDWLMCLINQKLAPLNKNLFRLLYDRTLGHKYTAILKEPIDENKKAFREGKKTALQAGRINVWVSDYLRKEKSIIQDWSNDVKRQQKTLEKNIRMSQELQDQSKERQATLDERKKNFAHTGEIETPIGQIKLALHDILATLPFLALVILAAMVRSTQRQLLLRQTFAANGPEDETTSEALSLTMPIWLEPSKSRFNNLLLLAGLAVLALAALFGLWQVMTNPGLAIAEVKVNNIFIIALTVIAAVIFSISYRKLVQGFLL